VFERGIDHCAFRKTKVALLPDKTIHVDVGGDVPEQAIASAPSRYVHECAVQYLVHHESIQLFG
jgi:hypothetical protein